jgi:hypothetical protein
MIPAAFLIFFGIIELVMITFILGALLYGKTADIELFNGPNSPELSQKSVSGMMMLGGLGLAWILAGRFIWRRKYLIGLLFVLASYPLGVTGSSWMFSSPFRLSKEPPASAPIQPRIDNRPRVPPRLAQARLPIGDTEFEGAPS